MAFNKAKAMQDAEKSVLQGKTSQAIKQYLQVIEKEPGDLGLLNTVGDLYVRDRNMAEALKYFHKLAESYTQEGFTVKAVAIYKKISKLDPSGVDVLIKMAELYSVQGLSREAREQYTQAAEFFKKKNQIDRVLEVLNKIVGLDPENAAYRTRLAEFCESAGKNKEASKAYTEAVEIALRRGDSAAGDLALKKALNLDAKNPQLRLLQARLALAKNQPNEVASILEAAPELKSDPGARKILLESFLASRQLDSAEKLVVEVFRGNPSDFSPVAAYAEQCIGNGDLDAALKPLAEVADTLIGQGNTAPLMEILRRIWAKTPAHLPTLELIYLVAEKSADEMTLPEVLDALGNAYVKAGQFEKAEEIYRRLVKREPENEQHKKLLNQVLEKQGKATGVAKAQDFSNVEMALSADTEEAPPAAAPTGDAEEAAVVKEAMDNCDLFARYDLRDKAIAELERVLALYPNQIEIHKRMLEVAQKGDPGRVARSAEALARIYSERGDHASAKRYESLAQAAMPAAGSPEAAAPAEMNETPEPAPAPAAEFDLSSEFLGGAPAEPPPAASENAPVDFAAPSAAESSLSPHTHEFDLSEVFDQPAAAPESAAPSTEAPPIEAAAAPFGFNFEESKGEVDYYLENGFVDEARAAVQALEEKFPGNSQVAELRRLIELKSPTPEGAKVEAPAAAPATTETEWDISASVAEPHAVETREEATPASIPPVDISAPTMEPPSTVSPPEELPIEASSAAELAPPASGGSPGGGLEGLIGDLESSLEGIETGPPSPAPQPTSPVKAKSPGTPSPQGREESLPPPPSSAASFSPLSGILDELSEGDQSHTNEDDPQTHYDLGVAFREMNLLDEAIGEFQKVVKGVQKGTFPPNFLQACTLLALCFMDKKLPAIAAKWYLRALELPDLDEEATMAVEYDLGVAYEQAGDMQRALEKFSEVYSQNIDYRDVAEKIRLLQAKS